MKLITILSIFSIFLISCSQEERRYCGVINKKYTVTEYRGEENARITFFNDSLKRNVDIAISWNTNSNVEVGQEVCFDLYDYQLNR